MNSDDRTLHWNNIYQSKQTEDVSWYQPIPTTSLSFLQQTGITKSAKIIDIGGGDSFFVDHLLGLGYRDITVLDVSEKAIEKAKSRLDLRAEQVTWITADISVYRPEDIYDIWHDRAAFHFLTQEEEIGHYLNIVRNHVKPGGYLILGTFSEQGPHQCSGLPIRQYSEESMSQLFSRQWTKVKCLHTEHLTPSGSGQNFVFCWFQRN